MTTDSSDAHACIVCLESESTESSPLLQTGCGCRGSAGWIHAQCAVAAAAAQQERTGSWGGGGKHPWQLCATCRVPYTGPLKLALARAWCARTVDLPADAMERLSLIHISEPTRPY